MSSRAISLYLHPETRRRIELAEGNRSAAEEVRLLAQIADELERAYRPDLLDGEWAAITSVAIALNYRVEEIRDLHVFPAMVEVELRRTRIAQSHGFDPDRLGYRMRQLRLPELVAVWSEIERRKKISETPKSNPSV